MLYEGGHGVAANAKEAVRMYRKGVAAGDAFAQYRLAYCLKTGIGVPSPDFHEAFKLLTAAAAQDVPQAIANLGGCYIEGRGVARDPLRGLALWERAQAHPLAHEADKVLGAQNLGSVYLTGEFGVPRNLELGKRYLRQAAAGGSETAARLLRSFGLT